VQLCDESLFLLGVVDLQIEPVVKLVRGGEDVGEQKIEKGPELVQVVLGKEERGERREERW
jgi:hypothetical protein